MWLEWGVLGSRKGQMFDEASEDGWPMSEGSLGRHRRAEGNKKKRRRVHGQS